MPESAKTRVAVIGAGAFGRNHLRVWQELERAGSPAHLTSIVEPNPVVGSQLATEYGLPVYGSVSEMLTSQPLPDAASVAVPTSLHREAAAQLLTAGIDVLLEKPMTATLAEADELISLAERHGRVLQVGHLERFNPAIRAIRPLVHRPLFFEVHRLSVFTPRSLDVDVVLDLMIHDLDVVLSFVQSPVRQLHAVGLPVLSSTVDIANVRIEFESGCVANFTASRVSTERVRKVRFFQPHQYISIDYARQDVLLVDVAEPTFGTHVSATPTTKTSRRGPRTARPPFDSPSARSGQAFDKLRTGSEATGEQIKFQPAEQHHPTPEFGMRKLEVPAGEPLRLELEAFLNAVRQRIQPEVSAQEGRAALALALDIRAAIEAHQRRAGL